MNNLLEVRAVSYKPSESSFLKSGKTLILTNVSFSMQKGDIIGIAGESGSGKTTLAKLIAGINQPSSGEIIINKSGEWVKTNASPVQILFQNNGEVLNPFRSISDIINEAVLIRYKNKAGVADEVNNILSAVNFPVNRYNKKGFQLSGGEQQRAALARTIAVRPELLILDEPFSAQDPESQLNLIELFKKLNTDYNISMLCISHDLKILKKLSNKILIMYKGEIVEQGNTSEIFSSPQHAYTKYLLKAEDYELSYEELKYIPD